MEKPSLLDKLLGRPFVALLDVLGKKIEFRILSNQERVEIWRNHPVSNLLTAPEAIAVPTLARAIVSIDGLTWEQFVEIQELRALNETMSVLEAVEKHLSAVPWPVVMELYSSYMGVIEGFQKNLDDLKKNSETPNPAPSGDSVKPTKKTL